MTSGGTGPPNWQKQWSSLGVASKSEQGEALLDIDSIDDATLGQLRVPSHVDP